MNDDVYILVKGTIIGIGAGADAPARQADERNKKILFQSFAPFTSMTAYAKKIICKYSNTNIYKNNAKRFQCIDSDV